MRIAFLIGLTVFSTCLVSVGYGSIGSHKQDVNKFISTTMAHICMEARLRH